MAEIISKAELARRLKLSRARITQYCHAGLPQRPDGLLDLRAALAWIGSHVDRVSARTPRAAAEAAGAVSTKPARRRSSAARPADLDDPQRRLLLARIKKLTADAERAEVRARVESGDYISAAEAGQYAVQFSNLIRDALLAQPDRLAPKLAATSDDREIYMILRDDVQYILRRLAKMIADAGFTPEHQGDQDE